MPVGTFAENLNSTLIAWALSKFFWYFKSKTYNLYSIVVTFLDEIKSFSDI